MMMIRKGQGRVICGDLRVLKTKSWTIFAQTFQRPTLERKKTIILVNHYDIDKWYYILLTSLYCIRVVNSCQVGLLLLLGWPSIVSNISSANPIHKEHTDV
jgi:hypothetical protein